MTTVKILFWISLLLCIYTYVGYGLILYIMVRAKRWLKGTPQPLSLPADDELPEVTFLVCAYNEEDVVEDKMKNTNALTIRLGNCTLCG